MKYLRFIGPDGSESIVEGKEVEPHVYTFALPPLHVTGEWRWNLVDAKSRRQPKKVGGGGEERGCEIERP